MVELHYGARAFCYQREYVMKLQKYAVLACVDDKHRVKVHVGEPCQQLNEGAMPAAERGRHVLVHNSSSFRVACRS